MNVLALNSSPRGGGQSKTEWMLDHLISGMQSAGATVEKIDLRKKKISYCIGCFTCWTKTPGRCVHKDDMSAELFPKYIAADLVVYATPLYHFTLNAQMKAFIERTLPILEPFVIKKEDGRSSHPLRYQHPDVVWISVAGFSELGVFDQLSQYINFLFRNRLLAEIYRPGAESMMNPGREDIRSRIAEAMQKAGREIVESKSVSDSTMAQIQQPITVASDIVQGTDKPLLEDLYRRGGYPQGVRTKGHDSATRFPGEFHGHPQTGVQSGRGRRNKCYHTVLLQWCCRGKLLFYDRKRVHRGERGTALKPVRHDSNTI